MTLTGWLAAPGARGADATNPTPDFKEIYDLLRVNLAGATDDNLNRAAVEGLLSRFPGRISLVSGTADGAAVRESGPALSKTAVIESNVAYLRVGRITGTLADELRAAYRALTITNKVAGVVLDLRFVDGDDSASAQAVANLFTSKKIAVGALVVLVNGETRGAAEMLAATVRRAGTGLIIGNPTAGEPATFRDFPLRNGEWLRIVVPPAKSGGSPAIPPGGLRPDIAVAVSAADERAFWDNPYASPAPDNNPRSATNNLLPFVDHTSEADLVRQRQRDGKLIKSAAPESLIREDSEDSDNTDNSPPTKAARPRKPMIYDPVLARAVDLVKGLAVVHQSHK
jgi:anti-anti-sigma regulatory factor